MGVGLGMSGGSITRYEDGALRLQAGWGKGGEWWEEKGRRVMRVVQCVGNAS